MREAQRLVPLGLSVFSVASALATAPALPYLFAVFAGSTLVGVFEFLVNGPFPLTFQFFGVLFRVEPRLTWWNKITQHAPPIHIHPCPARDRVIGLHAFTFSANPSATM